MRCAFVAIVSSVMLSGCAVVTQPSYPVAPPPKPEAPAQDASGKYGPEPGESLLQFGGSLTSQKTDSGAGGSQTDTSLSLQAGVGWFQSEWLELGGQLLTDYSDGGSTLISIAPYANGNYKLQSNPRVWLYAGPHLGLGYFDFANDSAVSIQYGLHGGARYWVDPRTSVFGELRYTRGTFEINSIDIDSDTVQLLFGFSVVF